ncbi:MAG: flagellar hook protein FlgE [Acidimicrobiia bacterium]
MFSSVSGLRSHQLMMDVIGNNIANVNTAGFKTSQVVFQDLLSQLVRGAASPQEALGGVNPAQVGLGVRVGGVQTSFAQGASQLTNRATDMSILGDGFFVLKSAGETVYSRLGAFTFDNDGRLVGPTGAIVQGWNAVSGAIDTNAPVQNLAFPLGQILPPTQATTVRLGGNIPSDVPIGTATSTSITIYDAQGSAIPLSFEFTKTATNTWTVGISATDVNGTSRKVDEYDPPVSVSFDPVTGLPAANSFPAIDADQLGTLLGRTFANGTTLTVDPGTAANGDALRQYAGTNSLAGISQNGSQVGFLRSFSVGENGIVTGLFSNGKVQQLAQIAVANFNNPGGLEKAGDSAFRQTLNSGLPQIGSAASGGRGTISGGTLEMSNVDLAQEFSQLIVSQRGFQANSRVISAADEILQDLVNLRR